MNTNALPASLQWVNTPTTPQLQNYHGRVVILYFWTLSNTHSKHCIEILRHLEMKHHDGLVVFGIHCPKFPYEQDNGHLLKAINQSFIKHPIAQDIHFQCWQQYAITAWPTVVVIAPNGNIVSTEAGIPHRATLNQAIVRLLDDAVTQDLRVYEENEPTAYPEVKSTLRFPMHVAASDRFLYIADTGHNCIIEASHDGRISRRFGSHTQGFIDGYTSDASFNLPEGLILHDDTLYVADTGNHAVRRIRLNTGEVQTLLGTGTPGVHSLSTKTAARELELYFPTAVMIYENLLWVTCTGNHQILVFDLMTGTTKAVIATGQHGHHGGTAAQCKLAKPTGMAAHGEMVYALDADASALCSIRQNDFFVKTLIGGDLYDFSHPDDSKAETMQLQHPIGLTIDTMGHWLWITDTYNQQLKMFNPATLKVKKLSLTHSLQAPSGLCIQGDSIWIANTNAHEILRVDMHSGMTKVISPGP